MNRPVPFGFVLSGLCSLAFWVLMAMLLLEPAWDADLWEVVLWRAAGAVLAALALVTTEALWAARPWAWRASISLAAAWTLSVFAAGLWVPDAMGMIMMILLPSFVVLGPMLAYIHNRTQRLWPQPGALRVHLPAASPYPPAHVAAARAATRP